MREPMRRERASYERPIRERERESASYEKRGRFLCEESAFLCEAYERRGLPMASYKRRGLSYARPLRGGGGLGEERASYARPMRGESAVL